MEDEVWMFHIRRGVAKFDRLKGEDEDEEEDESSESESESESESVSNR